MRFVHIADVHLGKNRDAGMSWENVAKGELYDRFLAFIDYMEMNPVEFLFITGDLFDHVPRREELEFVDQEFSRLENTDILYVTGECDHLQRGADMLNYQFHSRFYLLDGNPFRNKVKPEEKGVRTEYAEGFTDCVHFEKYNLDVYGICQFSEKNPRHDIDYVYAHNKSRVNILLMHGGAEDVSPFFSDDLKDMKFNYIGLGHFHSYTAYKDANAYYPGSLEPLGPDEEGVHGFIRGYVDNFLSDIKFVPFAAREYRTITLMADKTTTEQELEEQLAKICGKSKNHIYSIYINRTEDCHQDFPLKEFQKTHRVMSLQGNYYQVLDYEKLEKINSENIFGANISRLRNSKSEYSREALIQYTDFMWERLWGKKSGQGTGETEAQILQRKVGETETDMLQREVSEGEIEKAQEELQQEVKLRLSKISEEIEAYEKDKEDCEKKLQAYPDRTGDINTTWMKENEIRFEIDKIEFQDKQINKIYKRKRLSAMLWFSIPFLGAIIIHTLLFPHAFIRMTLNAWMIAIIEAFVGLVIINVVVYNLYNRGKKLRKWFFGVKTPAEQHAENTQQIQNLEQELNEIFSARTKYELDQRKHKAIKEELLHLEERILEIEERYQVACLMLGEGLELGKQ